VVPSRIRAGDVVRLGTHRLVCCDARDVTPPPRAGVVLFDPPFEDQTLVRNFPLSDFAAGDLLVFGNCSHATQRNVQTSLPWRFQFVWDAVARHCAAADRPLWGHKTCDWFSTRNVYDGRTVRDPDSGSGDDPRGGPLTSVYRAPITTVAEHRAYAKPVPWLAMLLGNCTAGLIVDPFAGTGSGLLAAEMLGRRWWGVEISPLRCDIIVARWESYSGETAEISTSNPLT